MKRLLNAVKGMNNENLENFLNLLQEVEYGEPAYELRYFEHYFNEKLQSTECKNLDDTSILESIMYDIRYSYNDYGYTWRLVKEKPKNARYEVVVSSSGQEIIYEEVPPATMKYRIGNYVKANDGFCGEVIKAIQETALTMPGSLFYAYSVIGLHGEVRKYDEDDLTISNYIECEQLKNKAREEEYKKIAQIHKEMEEQA